MVFTHLGVAWPYGIFYSHLVGYGLGLYPVFCHLCPLDWLWSPYVPRRRGHFVPATSPPHSSYRRLYFSLWQHCCYPGAISRTPFSCSQSGDEFRNRIIWQSFARTTPP